MLKGDNEKIAYRLKEAREMRGISQKTLAEMCGWTQSRIGNYESGIRSIGAKDAITLSEHLGLPPAELIFGKDENTTNVLADNEKELLWLFRQLPIAEQKKILKDCNLRLKELDKYVEKYLQGRHKRHSPS
ncbi:helix-turn-helix domain-containing protein [Klebsiella sp. WOUb02]|uniref:helix-turn-helix domain-containing protein n=1 Tax=Klebsiella sp. WOUb02 TaxID=3161071 RepID=UPI003CEE5B0A